MTNVTVKKTLRFCFNNLNLFCILLTFSLIYKPVSLKNTTLKQKRLKVSVWKALQLAKKAQVC